MPNEKNCQECRFWSDDVIRFDHGRAEGVCSNLCSAHWATFTPADSVCGFFSPDGGVANFARYADRRCRTDLRFD